MTTPMMLPDPVLKVEDLMCASCIFASDVDIDPESNTITCIRTRDTIAEYPIDFCCGEGGWFVGGMDLIHNLIQALQYFYIKRNAETREDDSRVEISTVNTKTPF